MRVSDLSYQAACNVATTINSAVWSMDRNRMVELSRKYGGLNNITRVLVAAGIMTPKQRSAAIGMMPRINNPSLRQHRFR